jgi:putative flippase GtrA
VSERNNGGSRIRNKRPLVFLGVGVMNTLLDFIFFTLLTTFILKDNIALAGLISGTIALIFAFLTHSFITWRGHNVTYSVVLKFFVVTGFGMWIIRPLLLSLFINLVGMYSFAYQLGNSLHLPFSEHFIANSGSFGFMIIIVLIYNYLIYDRVVFKQNIQDN